MPDGSHRVVFTNEAGVTFLDFEFKKDNTFEVKKILSQLDKKAVIETLRKDFYLILGLPFQQELQAWTNQQELNFGVMINGERYFLVTDEACADLKRLEIGSRSKQKVTVNFSGNVKRPDRIQVNHHTFAMKMDLTRLEKDAQ